MAKSNDSRQVDIGFIAGQILTASLAQAELDGLVQALKDGGSWQEVRADDAEILLDTNKVAYVRVAIEQHRVGFAGA